MILKVKVETLKGRFLEIGTFDSPRYACFFVKALLEDRKSWGDDYKVVIEMQADAKGWDTPFEVCDMHGAKISPLEAESEETASEAMEGMKKAVEELKVPHKPKEEPAKEEPEGQQSPEDLEEEKPEEAPEAGRKKGIDKGKIAALHNAGWNIAKIADEMRVSYATIQYHLKKLKEQGKIK